MFTHRLFSRGIQFAARNCIRRSLNASVISVSSWNQLSFRNGIAARDFTNGVRRLEQAEPAATLALKNARTPKPKREIEVSTVVTASKVKQSPLKMRFLVRLIRDRWLPDAMAQMKFTPKPRGADIHKMLKRASIHLNIRHDTIPEELWVKDVITTKGRFRKTLRYHGKGGVGLGSRKMTKVRITVRVIDFDYEIANAVSVSQKKQWIRKKQLVEQLRAGKKFEVNTTANTAVAQTV